MIGVGFGTVGRIYLECVRSHNICGMSVHMFGDWGCSHKLLMLRAKLNAANNLVESFSSCLVQSILVTTLQTLFHNF